MTLQVAGLEDPQVRVGMALDSIGESQARKRVQPDMFFTHQIVMLPCPPIDPGDGQ